MNMVASYFDEMKITLSFIRNSDDDKKILKKKFCVGCRCRTNFKFWNRHNSPPNGAREPKIPSFDSEWKNNIELYPQFVFRKKRPSHFVFILPIQCSDTNSHSFFIYLKVILQLVQFVTSFKKEIKAESMEFWISIFKIISRFFWVRFWLGYDRPDSVLKDDFHLDYCGWHVGVAGS